MYSDYVLKFNIDNDIPDRYKIRWYYLKDIFEQHDFNKQKKDFISIWLSYCILQSNINLPYLNRFEGGIGYDKGRQIRCRIKQKY